MASSKFFSAVTGRQSADISGSTSGSVSGMLLAAFGPSKRNTAKPDTAAAAKSLGVSQRTVQRWIAAENRQHQRPRADTLSKLAKKARQAASTKAGRRRAVAQSLGGKAPRGMRLSLTGVQGPGDPSYDRLRTVNFDLDDPALSQAFLNAYADGGDKGAVTWLEQNADETYNMDGWHIGQVDEVGIFGPYGHD